MNDIQATAGQKVVQEIQAAGGTAAFFAADVTRSDDVKNMVQEAVKLWGRLDVMINNAGWTHRNRPALEVSEDEFDKCYAVNMKSIYLSTVHAVPEFRKTGGGSFINIASTAGIRPRPGLTWYNGSKGAVITTSKLPLVSAERAAIPKRSARSILSSTVPATLTKPSTSGGA